MNRNMPAPKVKPRMPRNGRLVTKDLSQASSTFRKIGMILYLGGRLPPEPVFMRDPHLQ